MNTNENNKAPQELNASDYLGNYLKKEDIEGATNVTIIDVREDVMPNSDRRKLVVDFEEYHKAMVLNATNIRRLWNIFESKNTSHWRGAVTLYVDETVDFGGNTVGGLRIKPPSAETNAEDYRNKRAPEQYGNGDVPF